MLNYFATSIIPHNIIPLYHLNICLHLDNVAHIKTNVIFVIFVQYNLHTTFLLGDICCSLHQKCQYCAKRLRSGNYASELLHVHPVYHLNIYAPVSIVARFKAGHMPVMATKYHFPAMLPCADILQYFSR